MDKPVRAQDVQPERVEWLWRERIPRKMITVVAGMPDQGKGIFCVHVTAELSCRGLHVLLSASEDSHGLMTRPRLEAAGANLENVTLVDFKLPEDMYALVRLVQEHKIDLIVMDPFNDHLSDGVNRRSDSIRKVTRPLKVLLETAGAGCVVVEHALKRVPKNAHPLTAIGGSSSGLVAASRMGFVFGSDPEDEDCRMLCHVKGNIRDKARAIRFQTDLVQMEKVDDQPKLVYGDEVEFDPMSLFQTKQEIGRPAERRNAAKEWLTIYLFQAEGPVPASTLFEDGAELDLTAKTLRRAGTELGVLRNPPGGGRHCTWELPEELVSAMREQEQNSGSEKPNMELSDDDIKRLLGNDEKGDN